VLTIDYRGFGDSSQIRNITEESTTEDGLLALNWLISRSEHTDSQVMVWGHSMGAAIATITVAKWNQMNKERKGPVGLVIESGFNNFKDQLNKYLKDGREHRGHRRSLVKHLPSNWIINVNNLRFQTDDWISYVKIPILQLHAQDDETISVQLARKLYSATKEGGARIIFREFDSNLGHGHNNIYQNDNLMEYVEESLFVP